jgi:hypothetical protein
MASAPDFEVLRDKKERGEAWQTELWVESDARRAGRLLSEF